MLEGFMANSPKIDEIDRTILRHLKQNSRMSFMEMSRLTGISDATIQFRLKRMKANGAINKFTIILNPSATGYAVTAIMLVKTEADKHDKAKEALVDIPEVSEVYSVLGEYDLFIKVWSKGLEELNATINDNIRSIDGIEDLVEIVVVEIAKEESSPV
jgi:Lrp/AsnC family transcriptional regulator, regulator for asnA, asnC and gidA